MVEPPSTCAKLSAAEVVSLLDLARHPEGGFFRETFRDVPGPGGRPASSAIYYLLPAGERSHWHRIDAVEVWHFYSGAPLVLTLSADGCAMADQRLGSDLGAGERPQVVVPAGCWQTAVSLGPWTLAGCTVAPAFSFESFELAPAGWGPGAADAG